MASSPQNSKQLTAIEQCLLIISEAKYFNKNPKADRHKPAPEVPISDARDKFERQHARYQTYKAEIGETSLDFDDYVVHTAARATHAAGDIFAFKNKRLSFKIMADGNESDFDNWMIFREKFVKWGHLFHPIAHKRSAGKIFENLSRASIGIGLPTFLKYVMSLQQEWCMKYQEQPEISKFAPSERIVLTKAGVADLEYVIPNIGYIALTERHVLFQSNLTKSMKCWDLRNVSAEPITLRSLLKSGLVLRLNIQDPSSGRQTQRDLDFSNAGARNVGLLRDQICDQMRIMIKAHKIVKKLKEDDTKVASIILKDAGDECLRQRAVDACTDRSRKTTSFFIKSLPKQLNEYVNETKLELQKSKEAATASTQAKSSVFSQISNYFQTDAKELDPEANDQRLAFLDKEDDDQGKDEEINVQKFTEHVKILQLQLRPLFVLSHVVQDLLNWKNPVASLSSMLFLLWMAYADYVKYIPAFCCLLNGLVLALNKHNPRVLRYYRNRIDHTYYPPSQPEDESAQNDENTKTQSIRSKIEDRIKSAKSKFTATKKIVGSIQNGLTQINTVLFKIRSVYAWRAPKGANMLMILSFVAFVGLSILPHRIVFVICVIAAFTSELTEGSVAKDFFNEIPDDMPPQLNVPVSVPKPLRGGRRRKFSLTKKPAAVVTDQRSNNPFSDNPRSNNPFSDNQRSNNPFLDSLARMRKNSQPPPPPTPPPTQRKVADR